LLIKGQKIKGDLVGGCVTIVVKEGTLDLFVTSCMDTPTRSINQMWYRRRMLLRRNEDLKKKMLDCLKKKMLG
jgi:hypothetical protein